MAELSFDTLAYARRMEQVGFTRAQAEAMAEEQAKLIDERLATKADLAAVQAALDTKLAFVQANLKADIEALRLSTNADIDALRLSTKADSDALRQSTKSDNELLRRDIDAIRRDIIVKLGGIVIACVTVSTTVLTILQRLALQHP